MYAHKRFPFTILLQFGNITNNMKMTEGEKIRSEIRAKILKAMAHPSRIFIVEKLKEKSHCVCELTDMIGADVSTVSKHLSVLREAGLIESRKEGTSVYYTLTYPCVMDFIGCIETVAKKNFAKMKAFAASL